MKTAREKIREIRKSKGLSQGKLAQMLGYTPSTVSRIEQGALKPSLKFLQRFGETFGYSLSYLIDPKEPIFLDQTEQKVDLNLLEPALRELSLDRKMRSTFDITDNDIKRLAQVRFRAGAVDKQGYLGLLFFLRNLDRPN
jgi:transcriptional regulator with XRE-family HTH domain